MTRIAARAAVLFGGLLLIAGLGFASSATDFYVGLLRRGIANYETGHYEPAARELELAAFGLIESIDHFETAKVYAAIANDKLNRPAQARAAAQRVLAAERVQRRLSRITLPPEVRTAFAAVAKKTLTAPEAAALANDTAVPAAPQNLPRVTQTTPQTTPRPTPPATATNPPAQQQPAQQPVQPPANPPASSQPPKPATAETPKVIEQRTVSFEPPPKPKVTTTTPAQQPKPAATPLPKTAPSNIEVRLADASRLLAEKKVYDARAIYRQLVTVNLDRPAALGVAEGSYRAGDFATTVRALDRVGTLGKGEEPYRYYLAVALYETGQFARAKRELAAALPFIQMNESVAKYRAMIESAP